MNTLIYDLSKALGCIFARIFFRVRFLGLDDFPDGACLLACNHISHFDPPLVVIAVSRRVHFMTWNRLFKSSLFASWLRAVGCFEVDGTKPDIKAVRKAVRLLRSGRLVGIFPEGGIRSGNRSILEDTDLSMNLARLARLGNCPVRTCLVLGTDQLYDARSWGRRPEMILVGGKQFVVDPALPKRVAVMQMTIEIQADLRRLYREAFSELALSEELVPRTAQERNAG